MGFFDRQSSPVVVPFQRFPNQKPFLYVDGYYWTISPYIAGKKLHYKKDADRKAALHALQSFHSDTQGVQIQHEVHTTMFYIRWHKRLQLFEQTGHLFWKHGYHSMYKSITKTARNYLHYLSSFSFWNRLERIAKQNGVWIHGGCCVP